MTETPCVYKHTCGYDFCLMQDCPEYIDKKHGAPWYEDDPAKYDKEAEAYEIESKFIKY